MCELSRLAVERSEETNRYYPNSGRPNRDIQVHPSRHRQYQLRTHLDRLSEVLLQVVESSHMHLVGYETMVAGCR
jgi:hypothetical protein